MAKISIFTPCYNEEENVVALYEAVKQEMEKMPRKERRKIVRELRNELKKSSRNE